MSFPCVFLNFVRFELSASSCCEDIAKAADVVQEQKKLELFEEAARKQTVIMEANILGRGIDNHLLGLREAARETLGELPELFKDPTYGRMIEFKLSTSQVYPLLPASYLL